MKQKTIQHYNIEELDKLVNSFESNHNVKASQSYYADKYHTRVLFYEE